MFITLILACAPEYGINTTDYMVDEQTDTGAIEEVYESEEEDSRDVTEEDTACDHEYIWYFDTDGDRYGASSPNSDTWSCDPVNPPGPGYVDNADDCNDEEADTHPGATEMCDFVDNDCDGLSEVHDPDAVDFIYHDDDDGDGYGASISDGGWGCSIYGTIPDGHARSDDDCDDTDPNIYPGSGC